MRQACPAFVLPLVLFCFSLTGPVVAQNGPYVMIHVDVDGGLKANANGVVIGRHDDHAVIITNAHVALQATAITVQIGNQSHLAKIRNVDAANDFMILIIDGDFHDLRYALMAVEVPVGTRLKYCGFLPQNQWRLGCIPTRRIRNDRLRWYALDLRAVGGMSGGGIYTLDGHLAAILSLSQDGQTQVIPTPVIRRRLVEWGYVNGAVKGSIPGHHRPQQTPQQAEKNETAKESEPPKKAELAIKEAAESSTETKDEPKPEPVKPIEKIKDVAIFGARTYVAMKYGGVLAAVTGAAGWAGWLIGKRNERKRGGDPSSTVSSVSHKSGNGSPEALRETQERVVTVDTPPPKQIVTPEVRYAPYAVDEFAEAFAWAETQMARKYPGSVGTIETMKSMIDQFLTSKKERVVK